MHYLPNKVAHNFIHPNLPIRRALIDEILNKRKRQSNSFKKILCNTHSLFSMHFQFTFKSIVIQLNFHFYDETHSFYFKTIVVSGSFIYIYLFCCISSTLDCSSSYVPKWAPQAILICLTLIYDRQKSN